MFLRGCFLIYAFNKGRSFLNKNKGSIAEKIASIFDDIQVKKQNQSWLEKVKNNPVNKRRLLNRGEKTLFKTLTEYVKDKNLLVMAQVGMGEILSNQDNTSYRSLTLKE